MRIYPNSLARALTPTHSFTNNLALTVGRTMLWSGTYGHSKKMKKQKHPSKQKQYLAR